DEDHQHDRRESDLARRGQGGAGVPEGVRGVDAQEQVRDQQVGQQDHGRPVRPTPVPPILLHGSLPGNDGCPRRSRPGTFARVYARGRENWSALAIGPWCGRGGRGGAGGGPLRPKRPALERDREHDGRPGLHAALLAEAADQVLERLGRPRPYLEDVVGLTGDAEAVLDLAELLDPLGQIVRLHRIERRERDEGRDGQADRLRIEHGAVRPNDPRLLQLPHAVVHRRRREADAPADVRVGRPGVLLQGGDDLQVALVEHHPHHTLGRRGRARRRVGDRFGPGGNPRSGRLRTSSALGYNPRRACSRADPTSPGARERGVGCSTACPGGAPPTGEATWWSSTMGRPPGSSRPWCRWFRTWSAISARVWWPTASSRPRTE